MKYFEKYWLHKKPEIFNYSSLINDIIKCKNYYVNNNGNKNSENNLLSKLNSINKLFLTNNICESIHGKISNHLPNSSITKKYFKDTISYILKHYSMKNRETIRKDYISRSLIIIIEKYNLNKVSKFIDFSIFKKEIEKTIAFMTNKVNLNSVNEFFSTIIELEKDKEDNIILEEDLNSIYNEENENSIEEEEENRESKEKLEDFYNIKNDKKYFVDILNEHNSKSKISNSLNNLETLKDLISDKSLDEENSYEEEDIIRDKEVNPKNKGIIRKGEIRYNINDIILERKDLNIFNFDFNSESEFLKTLLLKEKDDLSIINDELLDLELSSEINELNRQPKCKKKI